MGNLNISCNNLSKSFSGKTIFKDLNFELKDGESVSVTGRNGSGKSTLIKIIANLIRPSKGNISFKSADTEIPDENRFMVTGLLSPYLNLYDELTASENLAFFMKMRNGSVNNELVNDLLGRTGLLKKKNELVRNYSSGMKQKLKLIFAVMNEPSLLMLDEPRTNLDKEGIDLVKLVCAEQRQKGILIIATNDEDDLELCEKNINIENYS